MNDVIAHTLSPDKWLENYADALYGFLYLRVKDATVCEDIVQDTFLSAWKRRQTYNKTFSEKTWLFSICKNKLVDYYRSLKQHNHITLDSHFFDEKEHWTIAAAPQYWKAEPPVFSG